MQTPRQVRRAVFLLWLSLAAGIVLTLLETAPNEALDEPWMEWLTWGSFTFAYAIMAGLILFIARRHNWARVTLLVITVLGFAAMAYPWDGLSTDYWEIISPANIVFAAMDGVALYWLFSGSGAAWFAQRACHQAKVGSR